MALPIVLFNSGKKNLVTMRPPQTKRKPLDVSQSSADPQKLHRGIFTFPYFLGSTRPRQNRADQARVPESSTRQHRAGRYLSEMMRDTGVSCKRFATSFFQTLPAVAGARAPRRRPIARLIGLPERMGTAILLDRPSRTRAA